jgi:hypothetical protein
MGPMVMKSNNGFQPSHWLEFYQEYRLLLFNGVQLSHVDISIDNDRKLGQHSFPRILFARQCGPPLSNRIRQLPSSKSRAISRAISAIIRYHIIRYQSELQWRATISSSIRRFWTSYNHYLDVNSLPLENNIPENTASRAGLTKWVLLFFERIEINPISNLLSQNIKSLIHHESFQAKVFPMWNMSTWFHPPCRHEEAPNGGTRTCVHRLSHGWLPS